MKLTNENTLFVMIDIQEAFEQFIPEINKVKEASSILNKAAEILEIPLLITEQYPEGLGNTSENIYIPESAKRFEKRTFTIFDDDISNYINSLGINNIVLYGIESHVCLMQSALDALMNDYEVFYVVNAVASRKEEDKKIAIKRLRDMGVQMVSYEMALFEILHTSEHPKFREISKLVK
ncbi:MAG: isochorismatase family protein [Candidatus Zophobacter franzmannii]|nr:isochorismatase family protein [Candidatus Zophobacter franzmannii]